MYKSYPLTKEIVIDLITESGNKLNSLWYIPPTSTDWNWLKTKKNQFLFQSHNKELRSIQLLQLP